MDLKSNDFVEIELNGLYKLAKVLDISELNHNFICKIQLVEDKSELLVGSGILNKINIFSLMKTNCPECGTPWSIESIGVHDIKKCKKCLQDGDEICIRFRKSYVQSQKQ